MTSFDMTHVSYSRDLGTVALLGMISRSRPITLQVSEFGCGQQFFEAANHLLTDSLPLITALLHRPRTEEDVVFANNQQLADLLVSVVSWSWHHIDAHRWHGHALAVFQRYMPCLHSVILGYKVSDEHIEHLLDWQLITAIQWIRNCSRQGRIPLFNAVPELHTGALHAYLEQVAVQRRLAEALHARTAFFTPAGRDAYFVTLLDHFRALSWCSLLPASIDVKWIYQERGQLFEQLTDPSLDVSLRFRNRASASKGLVDDRAFDGAGKRSIIECGYGNQEAIIASLSSSSADAVAKESIPIHMLNNISGVGTKFAINDAAERVIANPGALLRDKSALSAASALCLYSYLIDKDLTFAAHLVRESRSVNRIDAIFAEVSKKIPLPDSLFTAIKTGRPVKTGRRSTGLSTGGVRRGPVGRRRSGEEGARLADVEAKALVLVRKHAWKGTKKDLAEKLNCSTSLILKLVNRQYPKNKDNPHCNLELALLFETLELIRHQRGVHRR